MKEEVEGALVAVPGGLLHDCSGRWRTVMGMARWAYDLVDGVSAWMAPDRESHSSGKP